MNGVDQEDDGLYGRGVVIKMVHITTKSLQDCIISYKPPSIDHINNAIQLSSDDSQRKFIHLLPCLIQSRII